MIIRKGFVASMGVNQHRSLINIFDLGLQQNMQPALLRPLVNAIADYAVLATLADSVTAAWDRELIGLCYEKLGRRGDTMASYRQNIDSGVYTSFDGLTVSYPLTVDLRVSASVGQPVYFSDIYDELDYFFYSAHLDWEINSHWQLKSYYIEQTVNDVTDREALGARAVYIGKKITSFLTVDYDTAFSEINNILLNSNYAATENTNLNFTYGSQRSPFLTATNILIGQADLDLDLYLQSKENKDNLLDDALSRTALNEYFTVSINTRFTDRLRLIADYYDSALSDIPSTELLQGLPITTDSSGEFHSQSLGLQLVFQDFFLKNDSLSLGLRRNDGDSSTTNQIYINERLRLGRQLTINPRFSYADVQFASNADSQQQFRYSIALTYRPWRNVELNLEAGNESITTELSDTRYESDYIFAGYRFNF